MTMFGRMLAPPSTELKISKFRNTIAVPPKSTPTYEKSMPSPMERRKKSSRPPNPRRRENQNMLPMPK
jgi:hypothetical protein